MLDEVWRKERKTNDGHDEHFVPSHIHGGAYVYILMIQYTQNCDLAKILMIQSYLFQTAV